MRRRLQLSYLVLTVMLLAMLEIPLAVSHARGERADLTSKLERDAVSIAAIGDEAVATGDGTARANLVAVAHRYTGQSGVRVVVVDTKGIAVVDSDVRAASAISNPGAGSDASSASSSDGSGVGRSFSSRPEFQRALAGRVASGTRHSHTLNYDLLYVAVPIATGGAVDGAVRVSFPSSEVDQRIATYRLLLIGIAVLMLIVAATIGWALAAWTQRPLDELRAATSKIVGDGAVTHAHAPTGSGPPEVRALAREFNIMVDTIDSLLGAPRAFVSDASHQLRTPLAALRLRLDNLLAEDPDNADALVAAQLEVDRLASVIDGLLALARVDGTDATPTTVDVAEVARQRVETWRALAEERNITLVEDIAASPLIARSLPGGLEQVIDNLIDNALDATPDGGTITVKARAVPGADDIVDLVISDTGRGMTAEERSHAFDRFWRAGDAAPGGSGLGLAIVRELVEHAGGEITLAPAQTGDGLRVKITLRA